MTATTRARARTRQAINAEWQAWCRKQASIPLPSIDADPRAWVATSLALAEAYERRAQLLDELLAHVDPTGLEYDAVLIAASAFRGYARDAHNHADAAMGRPKRRNDWGAEA